ASPPTPSSTPSAARVRELPQAEPPSLRPPPRRFQRSSWSWARTLAKPLAAPPRSGSALAAVFRSSTRPTSPCPSPPSRRVPPRRARPPPATPRGRAWGGWGRGGPRFFQDEGARVRRQVCDTGRRASTRRTGRSRFGGQKVRCTTRFLPTTDRRLQRASGLEALRSRAKGCSDPRSFMRTSTFANFALATIHTGDQTWRRMSAKPRRTGKNYFCRTFSGRDCRQSSRNSWQASTRSGYLTSRTLVHADNTTCGASSFTRTSLFYLEMRESGLCRGGRD